MLTSNNKLFIKGNIDYKESLLILEHTSFPPPPPPPLPLFTLEQTLVLGYRYGFPRAS